MKRVKIVEQHNPYRLIRCRGRGHAVVEARAGRVYSMHCSHRREADDSETGMLAVVDPDGWVAEDEARTRYRGLIETGERFAKTIW